MALCSLRKAVATALGACAIMTFANMSSYAADKDIYATWDGDNMAAKVQYEYKPDSMFTVYGKPGYLTDIELKKGEVPNYIGAGDTSRWMIDQADVDGVHHIYIKPLDDNLETNLIVNTDERCYRFIIACNNDNYTPIVSFKFSAEEKAAEDAAYHQRLLQAMEKPLTKEERLYRDIFFEKSKNIYIRKKLNNRYEVVRHGNIADELYPVKIFDDGVHTYFQMASSNTDKMPVLYNINDEKKPVLVNYRLKGPFFIADQLFENCRLQYSAKSYLDVRSLDIRKNHLLPGKVDYSKLEKGNLHEKIAELQAKKQADESDSDEVDTIEVPSTPVVVSTPIVKAEKATKVEKVEKVEVEKAPEPNVEAAKEVEKVETKAETETAPVQVEKKVVFKEPIWTERHEPIKNDANGQGSSKVQKLIRQNQVNPNGSSAKSSTNAKASSKSSGKIDNSKKSVKKTDKKAKAVKMVPVDSDDAMFIKLSK